MTITTYRDGDVLSVALNRPEHGNRLDADTLDALISVYAVDSTAAPAAIVLTGVGPDFSLGRERSAQPAIDPAEISAEFQRIQRLNEAVQHCPAVTVAALRGRAEGAGLSLAARSDIVVVADDARLSFPEIPHGIPPTIVLSHYRYVLPRSILGDLIYTGRELSGAEAVQFGLAARSVPADEVESLAMQLATRASRYDRRSIALVKQFLRQTESIQPQDAPAVGISMYAVEMAHRLLST